MWKENVRTPEEALVYLTDCTLATVDDMARKKSRPKGEYQRQKAIAQQGIDWIKEFQIKPDSRPRDVIKEFAGSVEEYSKTYDVLED